MEPDYLSYQQPHQGTSFKTHLIELFQTLVVFAAIGTAIYWLVAQPHKVSGSSMFPNFKDGDYIITDKISYRIGEPRRGDVVVFKNPKDKSQDFIKRVMGLPGDVLKIENSHVYVNGKLLEEPFLEPEVVTEPRSFLHENQEITVADGSYLVFGDNRPYSSDSREWGFITKKEILGKVFLRYWPQNKIGFNPAAFNYNF